MTLQLEIGDVVHHVKRDSIYLIVGRSRPMKPVPKDHEDILYMVSGAYNGLVPLDTQTIVPEFMLRVTAQVSGDKTDGAWLIYQQVSEGPIGGGRRFFARPEVEFDGRRFKKVD